MHLSCPRCGWRGIGPIGPTLELERRECCTPSCPVLADTQQPLGWRCHSHPGIGYAMCGLREPAADNAVCTLPYGHDGDEHVMWTPKQYIRWREVDCEDCDGTGRTIEPHCDGGIHGERGLHCAEIGCHRTHPNAVAWDSGRRGWHCRRHGWTPAMIPGLVSWMEGGVDMLTGKPVAVPEGEKAGPVIAYSRKLTGSETRKVQEYVSQWL